MHWIAPSEKDAATATLESRPWYAADQFRANSGLKSQEYAAFRAYFGWRWRYVRRVRLRRAGDFVQFENQRLTLVAGFKIRFRCLR